MKVIRTAFDIKDFVGISNAVLITFNIQSHSQVNAGADLLVVACVKCCVHLVFSVVVAAADVVTITTHDEHVKYRVVLSNAVLITFNIQPHSQINDLQPEKSQPSPRISVLASDGNV